MCKLFNLHIYSNHCSVRLSPEHLHMAVHIVTSLIVLYHTIQVSNKVSTHTLV